MIMLISQSRYQLILKMFIKLIKLFYIIDKVILSHLRYNKHYEVTIISSPKLNKMKMLFFLYKSLIITITLSF